LPPEHDDVERGSSLWLDAWHRLAKNRIAVAGGVILILLTVACFIGPLLTKHNYYDQNLNLGPTAPSAEHWLGTDKLGRDQFVRVQLVAVMMRIVDLMYSLPVTIFVILIPVFFRELEAEFRWLDEMGIPFNLLLLFGAVGVVEWLTMARIVREQVMSLRKQEF